MQGVFGSVFISPGILSLDGGFPNVLETFLVNFGYLLFFYCFASESLL